MSEPREVPAGCQEIPGFILMTSDEREWFTQDGRLTQKWSELGVWPTREEANEFLNQLFPDEK